VATAGVNRMMLWTDLEGREVNGRWRLERLVRPEGRTAWFEGTGLAGRAAMLSLTEAMNDEEDLLERLRLAAEIRHPNVVEIRESLFTWVEDTPVVLAEMEPTEENLGDVLRERSLSAEETRLVMDALLAGLAAIHRKKLMHGRMEAASVVAMGQTIKLRSDCLHSGNAAGFGDDLRGVARIVVQALTRRLPSGENDPVLQLLPEPMARAVRRALSGNATVEEVAALAGTKLVPAAEPAPAPPQTRPAAELKAVPRPAAENRPTDAVRDADSNAGSPELAKTIPADQAVVRVLPLKSSQSPAEEAMRTEMPAAPAVTQSPLLMEDDEPEWDRRRSKPYVIGAAVVLVLVTIFVLYGMLHRGSAPKPVAAQQPQSVPPASAGASVASGQSAASRPSPRTDVESTTAGAGPGWRVVAYTYNHQAQAQQKAEALAKRYPELQPRVFEPRAGSAYLVTLGGIMSRADAIALRAKAIRMGLPRDTYARNYR
jgi:eukaryotic-like serine/threonine-protein kinase